MKQTRAIQKRSVEKRKRIIHESMECFATYGYLGTSVDRLAQELHISKGSIFQHFGSKENLFLAVYKQAVSMLPTYLDVPKKVLDGGFFATVRHWLEQSEHLVREDLVPYRVSLIGNYGVDVHLRLAINRFLRAEDPYRTLQLVSMGIERGEVRQDIDTALVASTLHWFVERFQDVLVTEELGQGFFTIDPPSDRLRPVAVRNG